MNEQGLYDIYGHWHVPFWQTRFFIITVILFCVLLLLGLLFLLIKKYYKKKQLTADQKALVALANLSKRKIHTRDDAQQIYFELTDIFKHFFQAHFGINFEGLTDYEMIDSLKKVSLPNDDISLLNDLVESSLSVKYAGENALQEQISRHIQIGTAIIQRIKARDITKK